jgi:lipid-A-disaccharide synthase
MLKAVRLLEQQIPGIEPVVAAAHGTVEEEIRQIGRGVGFGEHLKVIRGQTHTILSASDLAIVACGTATLETALLGIPQVAVYRTSSSTYYAAKLLVKIPHVALPNIVAGRQIIPELLQNEANPANIAHHLARIWQEDQRQMIQGDYEEMRRLLGDKGAITRAARIVLDVANEKAKIKKQ